MGDCQKDLNEIAREIEHDGDTFANQHKKLPRWRFLKRLELRIRAKVSYQIAGSIFDTTHTYSLGG